MNKKLFYSVTILLILTLFAFTISYGAENMINDAVNDTEGIVNGAINGIEGTAEVGGNFIGDVGRTAGNITENVVSGAGNLVEDGKNTLESGIDNMANTATTPMTDFGSTYTAQRTSTTTPTFLGMNADAWSWIIVGVLGIAIIALVWIYGKEHSSSYDNYNE